MRNENEKSFAEEKNKRNHSPGREMCKLNYVCFILIQSHRSVNGQRQGAGLPVPTDVKLQHFKPIYKFYRQLSCTSSPVSHGPFLTYIAISEVKQFFKGGVVREHALVFLSLSVSDDDSPQLYLWYKSYDVYPM